MRSHRLAGYAWRQSYDWNYEHAPEPVPQDEPKVPGHWDFCGLSVGSPLGIAAGPLLNGRWILYYAALGFDVLTYKTVRSRSRACYPMPNLQPVATTQMRGRRERVAGKSADGRELGCLVRDALKSARGVACRRRGHSPRVAEKQDTLRLRRRYARGRLDHG